MRASLVRKQSATAAGLVQSAAADPALQKFPQPLKRHCDSPFGLYGAAAPPAANPPSPGAAARLNYGRRWCGTRFWARLLGCAWGVASPKAVEGRAAPPRPAWKRSAQQHRQQEQRTDNVPAGGSSARANWLQQLGRGGQPHHSRKPSAGGASVAASDGGLSASSADVCVSIECTGDGTSGAPALGKALLERPSLEVAPCALRSSLCACSVAGSEWFDASSCFDAADTQHLGGDDLAALLDAATSWPPAPPLLASPPGREPLAGLQRPGAAVRADAGAALPGVPRQLPGPHVPSPPLLLADRDYTFVPVPAQTGFGGYWMKDPARTTPSPQPIDVMMRAGRLARKAHDSLPGIWLDDGPSCLTITAKPRAIPAGLLSRYTETFPKDGSAGAWAMRRDVRIGRSTGQVFFTSCGTLIFRVYYRPLWGEEPEFVSEEYSRLEDSSDGGRVIVSRQACADLSSGASAVQWLVGRYAGERPPPGH